MTDEKKTVHDRSAWRRGASGAQTIKGRNYKNLVEFTRPCASCSEPFAIYVTPRIADGHADSNSFALKNCEKHRRGLRSEHDSISAEVVQLRTENRNLRDECNGHLAYIKELEAELAQYRPPTVQEVLQKTLPWA